MHMRVLTAIVVTAILAIPSSLRADEAAVAADLTAKGVKLTQTKGETTALDAPDPTKLTDADLQQLAQLPHLQKLNFGRGLTNQQLAILTQLSPLPDITSFSTNGAALDDDGVAQLARFKNLQSLTFFHPGKNFLGPGLLKLADLPKLDNLTVAGSAAFANDGLSAIPKLPHLKSLRLWHIGADSKGVAALKDLASLASINLGQRLSLKPPTMVADDTVALLLPIKTLESITLSESRITLDALSQLKELPSLKRLTLDSIEVPEADVESLRKALPNVHIDWTQPKPEYTKRIEALFAK